MSITNFLSILHCHSGKLGLTEWGGRHTASRLIYFSQQRVSGLSGLILLLCKIFSAKFNTMSAVSAHHLPALPQKIDSREGLFRLKMGLVVNVGKMNIYFMMPPFSPYLGSFAAKYTAFWC